MKTLTLTVLLLAAAGPAHAAVAGGDVTQPPERRADGPVAPEDPAQLTAASRRAEVLSGCEQAFPDEERVCACVADRLQAPSRDQEVVTAEDLQAALRRCREL